MITIKYFRNLENNISSTPLKNKIYKFLGFDFITNDLQIAWFEESFKDNSNEKKIF